MSEMDKGAAGEQGIRTRDQMDIRWMWELGDLYAGAAAWEAEAREVPPAVAAAAAFEGTLAEGGRTAVLEAVRALAAASRKLDRVGTYAFLFKEQDNGNPEAQAMWDKVMALSVELETATAYLQPELLTLPEELLHACMQDPAFAEYDVYLKNILRTKPHTLTAAEERIISAYGEVVQGPQNTMQMLTCVDMRFPSITNEEGRSVEVTEGKYGIFLQSKDQRVRAEAFESVLGTYASFGNTFAATYATNVKADVVNAKLHRFSSARASFLFPDQVPESVYDSLIEAVHTALPDMARYVALKRKALGLKEVHNYDLYAPMAEPFDMELPYPNAYALVKEGVAVLGADYVRVLGEAYENRWIDVYENRGKNTGAFCSECYDAHPYVLLNHQDDLYDTLTIAHEMGHAMHSYLSQQAQPHMKADYTIFVAEVASTVNEILTLRHLMQKHEDKASQMSLINQLLEHFRTTVFRQTLFAEFELKAHRMAEEGEALTRESLSAMYLKLNEQYYGAEAVIDPRIADEWMRIPHFYSSFYVYKYATGFSAAVAIVQRLLTEGAPAVRDYLRFLSLGGSMPPIEELKVAGVDMSTPAPVTQALRYFGELVVQMEAYLA